MSKHTPGPWRVGRKVGRTIYCEEAGTGGRLIGVMDRIEDAQLAAASPELLEIAQEMLGVLDATSGRGNKWEGPIADKCRAAIAKATGGDS